MRADWYLWLIRYALSREVLGAAAMASALKHGLALVTDAYLLSQRKPEVPCPDCSEADLEWCFVKRETVTTVCGNERCGRLVVTIGASSEVQ